jgi:hypothetical protein
MIEHAFSRKNVNPLDAAPNQFEIHPVLAIEFPAGLRIRRRRLLPSFVQAMCDAPSINPGSCCAA